MARSSAAIYAAVEQNLMDGGAASEVLGRIVEFIQRAQVELEDAHVSPDQKVFYSATTSVGVNILSVAPPTNFIGVRMDRDASPIVAPHYIGGNGVSVYLSEGYSDDPSEAFAKFGYDIANVSKRGAPKLIYRHVINLFGTEIVLFALAPVPDAANPPGTYDASGNYQIRLPYWRRLAQYVKAGLTNWFTENADYYLEWSATAHGLVFNRDYDGATPYISLATGELERLKDLVYEGRTPTVVSVHGGYALGRPGVIGGFLPGTGE